MGFLHEHKWVQIKDVFWNDKNDTDKKGIFLFCESCHATCAISLKGNMPQYGYIKKKEKK